MLDPIFVESALEKFSGCDSEELHAGSPAAPSIWLFGIEHGGGESVERGEEDPEGTYPIELQVQYRYNVRAFKLLAAMRDNKVEDWYSFALKHRPFVYGSAGYFKGNLYPVPCHRTEAWPTEAARETGTDDKHEYLRWCREQRLPLINSWIEEYQPELFLGVGITCREEFSQAVFGETLALAEHCFKVNGHQKRMFYATVGRKKLLVIPHFSGRYGLNSNKALQYAGTFAKALLNGEIPPIPGDVA